MSHESNLMVNLLDEVLSAGYTFSILFSRDGISDVMTWKITDKNGEMSGHGVRLDSPATFEAIVGAIQVMHDETRAQIKRLEKFE